MRKFVCLWILTLCVSLAASVQAEPDHADVEIKVQKLSKSVYMLTGSGGNIGLSVGADGVLMIDDQFAPLSEKIEAAIAELGSDRIRYVLNTHWHGDHTGGNEHFGAKATIIAHDNVRLRMAAGQEMKFFDRVVEPSPAVALPVITYEESVSVHFNGDELMVFHFPGGHTDGDSVIFFVEENVVHLGDLFFNGMYPFIDLESGGDVDAYIANVAELMTLVDPDAKIIPGHGPLAEWQDLADFHEMLKLSRETVAEAVADGKSLEEAQEDGLDPEIVERWGKGFLNTDKWITIIYKSLTREPVETPEEVVAGEVNE